MPTFTLVEEAVIRPNACLCQNNSGPFIDMGFERWGEEIYVCHRCIRQIFELYDHVPADVHKRECARLDEASAKVTTLTGELEAARAKAADVEAANGRLIDRVDELSQERGANAAYVAKLQEDLKHAQKGTKSLKQAKADIPKPAKTKRPVGVKT